MIIDFDPYVISGPLSDEEELNVDSDEDAMVGCLGFFPAGGINESVAIKNSVKETKQANVSSVTSKLDITAATPGRLCVP